MRKGEVTSYMITKSKSNRNQSENIFDRNPPTIITDGEETDT